MKTTTTVILLLLFVFTACTENTNVRNKRILDDIKRYNDTLYPRQYFKISNYTLLSVEPSSYKAVAEDARINDEDILNDLDKRVNDATEILQLYNQDLKRHMDAVEDFPEFKQVVDSDNQSVSSQEAKLNKLNKNIEDCKKDLEYFKSMAVSDERVYMAKYMCTLTFSGATHSDTEHYFLDKNYLIIKCFKIQTSH